MTALTTASTAPLNTLAPGFDVIGPREPLRPRSTPRILLVDDEPRLLNSLHALLFGQDYELVTALGGRAAIDALIRQEFDLVLLDLRMPDVGGHDVMDHINEFTLDVHVIVVSGDTDIDSAIGVVNRGVDAYLRKPYRPDELLTAVKNALEKRRLQAENRRITDQLERSEKLYRFLIDNSPDIIYMLDAEGRFTYVNGCVTELLGFDRDALIGRPYTMIVHDDDIERARYVFNERRIGKRASRNVELRLKCSDSGTRARTFDTSLCTISFSSVGLYMQEEGVGETTYSGTYGIARDITERKRNEELISYHAYHDILTDLPNRILFRDRLDLAMIHARRNGTELAVMFVDLDRFKVVNDSLGHMKGDDLLRQVAARLKSCLRKGDTLARVGGDEFIVLLPELRERTMAKIVADKFLQSLSECFVIDDTRLYVSASIGIAIFPEDGATIDDLVRHADIAMYQVKSGGKNGYCFFDSSMQDAAREKVRVEHELRKALQAGELEMYYQPQIDVATGAMVGAEALMRWNHPERGLLSAAEFLPLAEETGLMIPLTDWMLNAVCHDLRHWTDSGCAMQVSINLSPTCLGREDFLTKLHDALVRHRVSPGQIEVEITENVCIRNPEYAIQQLKRLVELGLKVAIDDFGTGYSSLAYLHRFPIHTIKIDQSFVSAIRAGDDHYPVVLAVISIARGLGLGLVAEGVETREQSHYLEQAGCRTMQGFYYSRPLSRQALTPMLLDSVRRAEGAP
jgi:diguanylate cyclase (GGDEF)-like protein/PAS domain S-box-containing protein